MLSALRSGPFAAYGLYMIGSVLMASNPVIGRAVAHVVPPIGMTFWRWAFAVLMILPLALPGLLTHRRRLAADWRRILLLGVLGQGISGGIVYCGLEHTGATNASLIYATSPVMVLIIAAVWLGETIRPRQIAGILLAMAGVLAILTRGDSDVLLGLTFNIGDLLVLCGAVAWSFFTILLRQSRDPLPDVTLFAASATAGMLVIAPFYAWETLAGRPVPFTNGTALLAVGAIALFSSVLSFLTYQKTIALMGAARASTAMYVAPLWVALASALLLGERLEPFHLAGVLLVLPGVGLATVAVKPRPVAGAPCRDSA